MKTCSAAASFPSVFICTWSYGQRSMLSLQPGAWHSLSPNAGNKMGCTERASCCPACDFERQEETKHLQASACSQSHGPAAFESPVTTKVQEPKAFMLRVASEVVAPWTAGREHNEREGLEDQICCTEVKPPAGAAVSLQAGLRSLHIYHQFLALI